jgi:hypothetical protein
MYERESSPLPATPAIACILIEAILPHKHTLS